MHVPTVRFPLDADDRAMLARVAIYSVLVVWSACVLALAVGLAIRIILALI